MCLLLVISGTLWASHSYSVPYTFAPRAVADSLKSVPAGRPGARIDTTVITVKDSLRQSDSLTVVNVDTLLKVDTLEESEIKDIIKYHAYDSIVYDMESKKMYLYDTAEVNYTKINLKADYIEFDWNTYILSAEGVTDSNGEVHGKPVFIDDGQEYHAGKMEYGFKTKKGKAYAITMKQGESYLLAEEVKKNEYDEWYGKTTKYTTCDLEHPHFYFKAKKIKMVPNKVLVTGPANLWVGDVPTPLYLPFALFPVKQGRRSGIVMPEYGGDGIMGFFLRNGGYYWAVNDYLSLKFTGLVATNGTFGATVATQYRVMYKFNGAFSFGYVRTRAADPDLPSARSTNSYQVSWTHNQDPKSIPNSTFGASVQMQSADFYQATRTTDTRLLNTSFNSGVNFSHNFAGTPVSVSLALRHTQNLLNRTIGFTLPQFHLAVSRISPFKSKVQSGKPKWFESIGFTYGLDFQNVLNTYDSTLFNASSLDKFRFGVSQSFNVDAPITVFKYLNVNPAFSYQERTYFKGINKYWNPDTLYTINAGGGVDTIRGRIVSDTIWRFNSARDFNASLTFSTKMIGIFKFKGKLKAIKHVFTPSVSFNYHPDFSSPTFRYYRTVQSDAVGNTTNYSVFEPDAVYGVPGGGRVGSINFNLGNNFEMKTYSKADTVNHEKKVGLLDQVNISGGYNFAADSLKLLPFNLTVVSSRIFNLVSLNFNASFDPYATDSFNRRVNTFQWDRTHRLLRFSSANVSASTSLHSKQNSTAIAPVTDNTPVYTGDYVTYDPNAFYNFNIPWTVSLSYRFNLTRGTTVNPDTIITVQSISASADFNLTKNWKVAVSTGFDISNKRITLTNISVVRDLHCWELAFTWTPALSDFTQQQFTIMLHPKSGTLKDLKLQKKNSLQGL